MQPGWTGGKKFKDFLKINKFFQNHIDNSITVVSNGTRPIADQSPGYVKLCCFEGALVRGRRVMMLQWHRTGLAL